MDREANNPNLRQQAASAYGNDMSVTNPLFPDRDGQIDIDEPALKEATAYVQTLIVPARTLLDDDRVQRSEKFFASANCTVCHIP